MFDRESQVGIGEMEEGATSVIENHLLEIDSLIPHKRNYRQHPDMQLSQLGASHERFGQFRSVVVVERAQGYTIVAGHGIVEAMKRNGVQQVRADVLPASTSEEDVEAILIADNLLPQGASDDNAILAELLQSQVDSGYDLSALGSDEETLRQMVEALGDEYAGTGLMVNDEDETLPEDVPTRSQLGDIWQLGRHRIACMDALDYETYAVLLGDVKPDAIITDPPYGMRLDADFSSMVNKLPFAQKKGIKSGRKYDNVIGDHQDFNAALFAPMFSGVKEQFWFGADYYSATLPDTMHTGCWLVWDKRLDESADKMYGSCFELIWSKQKHKRDMLRHKWAGVFGPEHEPPTQRGRQHPNQKPVRLLEDIMMRYTSDEQIILDPFLGSGSVLISAESTNRIAYGCEISPFYCDVILARWERLTGQTATLIERIDMDSLETQKEAMK